MSAVSARNIVKQFGAVPAVNGISLEVPNGEHAFYSCGSGAGPLPFSAGVGRLTTSLSATNQTRGLQRG